MTRRRDGWLIGAVLAEAATWGGILWGYVSANGPVFFGSIAAAILVIAVFIVAGWRKS